MVFAIRAHVIGSFAVFSRTTGKEVTPRGRKARALLAYLISHAGTKMPKSRLASLLWADRGDAQARSSLRQVLLELRRALNQSHDIILSDREHIWISSEHLTENAPRSDGRREDAFEDLDAVSPEFDEWLGEERSRRSTARITALKAEAGGLLATGLGAKSSMVIGQIRALDPHDEDALRLGMQAEFEQGRPAAIAKRFKAMETALKDELGVEPSSQSRELRDRLLTKLPVIASATGPDLRVLYEEAERLLKMGAWECELLSGQLCWTPGTFRLFGIPVGSTIYRDEILGQYDTQSRQRLEVVRAEAIRKGSGFSIDANISSRDGSKKRLRIIAAVETRNGIPSRIFGTKQLVG